MSQREKKVKVTKENGDVVEIVVKRPTPKHLSQAQMIGSRVWTQAVRDGIFTKIGLEKFMEENGIWDSEKAIKQTRILQQIGLLEKEIASGKNPNGTTLKLSEGKNKAIELRRLRIELRELIAEKIALESNTAEGLADNSKFNYLVSQCTYYSDGKKVYSSLDDYNDRSDDEISFSAAAALGEIVYNLDRSYEESLPENQFLKKYHFVNEDLSLIDKDGNRVDVDGTPVNDRGWLINDKGERVDREGNLLTESGNLLVQGDFIDDLNEKKKTLKVKPTKIETSSEGKKSQEEAKDEE
jgi:hypothetical protein